MDKEHIGYRSVIEWVFDLLGAKVAGILFEWGGGPSGKIGVIRAWREDKMGLRKNREGWNQKKLQQKR